MQGTSLVSILRLVFDPRSRSQKPFCYLAQTALNQTIEVVVNSFYFCFSRKLRGGNNKLSQNQNSNSCSSSAPPPLKPAPKRSRGRVKKTKLKKAIKINGLDLLHSQTLLSTSPQAVGKKPPPAPGCVDQQLTSLSTAEHQLVHTELEIPQAPGETPYALQILLDMYRTQFMQMIDTMKNPGYKDSIKQLLEAEKVCSCFFIGGTANVFFIQKSISKFNFTGRERAC